MHSIFAKDHGIRLSSVNNAMDVLSCGVRRCLFTIDDIDPVFFNLSNGIAGEVFQKFVNYNIRIAIVLPADHSFGDRVTELAREHGKHPMVRFFDTLDSAESWLAS